MIRLLVLALLLGCATTSPYVGPAGQPHLVHETRLIPRPCGPRGSARCLVDVGTTDIVNPGDTSITAVLDCSSIDGPGLHDLYVTVVVPPRTIQHVLASGPSICRLTWEVQ